MKRDALLNSRLFSGLPPRALFRLCGCIGCTFVRSETGFVVSAQDGAAVLLEGLAAPRGGGIAGPGDSFPLFSGAAVPTSTGALLAVVSAEQAVGLCRNACPAHRSLARNMLALLADSCRAPDTPELRRDVAAVLLIYGGEGQLPPAADAQPAGRLPRLSQGRAGARAGPPARRKYHRL